MKGNIYTKKTLQNIHKSYRDYLEGTPAIDKPWFKKLLIRGLH